MQLITINPYFLILVTLVCTSTSIYGSSFLQTYYALAVYVSMPSIVFTALSIELRTGVKVKRA